MGFGLIWVVAVLLDGLDLPQAGAADPRFAPNGCRREPAGELLAGAVVPVGQWFWNSFVVATVSTLLTLMAELAAGYAFARISFVGREVLFVPS